MQAAKRLRFPESGHRHKQFEDAIKEIEKQLGKRLSDKERRKLHDHISGQDYGYHEIVEEGYWLLND